MQGRLEQAYPKQWKDDLAAAWLAASYKLLHQDKEANQLIAGPQRLLIRKPKDAPYVYGYYYDSLIRDASVLYLLAKHFPDHATALPPEALENIVAAIARGNYNTLSSAMTVLALDAYATQTGADVTALGIGEVGANGAVKPIAVGDRRHPARQLERRRGAPALRQRQRSCRVVLGDPGGLRSHRADHGDRERHGDHPRIHRRIRQVDGQGRRSARRSTYT